MKFTASKTREEANEYLKLRIGVTWEEHERMAKTLADIKMMLIQDRLWHTDEDQFLRRMVYESQANRKLDWKKLLFVSGAGGFVWVSIWIILAQIFGVISISVPL